MTLRQVHIENYKSVEKLSIDFGRLNVFIGENGCGKSNILEAIAFASAAHQDKLDNEFLVTRGIRTTEPRFMRSAFTEEQLSKPVEIELKVDDGSAYRCVLDTMGTTLVRWTNTASPVWAHTFAETIRPLTRIRSELGLQKGGQRKRRSSSAQETLREIDVIMRDLWAETARQEKTLAKLATKAKTVSSNEQAGLLLAELETFDKQRQKFKAASQETSKILTAITPPTWIDFLIYAPENSTLRTFQSEGQILPLGIKGEGLFAHLKALNEANPKVLEEITSKLALIDWFQRFEIPGDLSVAERTLRLRDRYLAEGALFDQRSANEGFLFLLFYFTLFISPDTPSFFAIDNVDTSLNPKLCAELVAELARLSAAHGKQAILTTHNPAALDGLDLHDDEQRLFVIHRNSRGATKARRVPAPTPIEGRPPMKLSEAFLAGHIGGLPKNF